MAGCKDYIMLCVDTGPSMDSAPLDVSDTRLDTALRIVSRVVQQKMFAGSKDYVGLVLFGTSGTDNDLAVDSEGYQNITVAWQPAPPTLEFLRYMTNDISPGDTPGDFLDALVVAMDVLVKVVATAKRVGEKKIYLVTDAGSEYTDNGLGEIAAGLREKGIQLIVVGPDLDSDGDGGDGGGGGGDSVMKKTAQQLEGEAVLSRLVNDVDGVGFSFQEASQVANFIRKTGKKQTTRFAGHLELGPALKIPCKIFTKVMHERPATWKKLSAVSQASRCPGQQTVSQKRSYHINDEDETEVEPDTVVKGYRYGKSLVPITEEDEEQMKMLSERCLSLLGFSPLSCVCSHQTVGTSVQVVVPNPLDQAAGTAMSALIHALYETGNVGVARFIARKNATPRLVALLPQIKAAHECLVMLHLPFMEDVRQYTFPSLSGPSNTATPTAEQLTAVDTLISNMDLMTADRDEEGKQCEALRPKTTMNPLTQRVFQCISQRALDPDSTVPDVEPRLTRILEPGPAILSLCSSALASVKERFPLMRVEKKEDKMATDVWKESSAIDMDAPAVKKSRVEDDTDFSMASLARGEVTEVGTLDPVADFSRMVSRTDSNFPESCKQLERVLMQLVRESFGDSQYQKALDCLRCLRRECIQRSEVKIFNDFLGEVKGQLIGTRYSSFWECIVTDGVTMVTTSECSASTVSDKEAKEFLVTQLPEKVEEEGEGEGEGDEADDLLAMM